MPKAKVDVVCQSSQWRQKTQTMIAIENERTNQMAKIFWREDEILFCDRSGRLDGRSSDDHVDTHAYRAQNDTRNTQQ